MRIKLLLFTLFIAHLGLAQKDDNFVFDTANLNQKDEKGRFHGFWVKYLTDQLKPCKKEVAHYYAYELYDHGERVQKFYYQRFKKRGAFKADVLHSHGVEPFILEGTFEWSNKKGQVVAREIYKEGRPHKIMSFRYSRKNPGIVVFTESLHYDKLYSGKVGTFYYEEHTRGTLSFKGYFRKRDRGWRVYGSRRSNPKYKRSTL